jgi:succinate dehydrogenase / fumarate reductase, flavoprotein subunit
LRHARWINFDFLWSDIAAVELLDELRDLMWRDVGPFRTAAGLTRAVTRLAEMRQLLPELAVAPGRACNPTLADWFELRASRLAAEAVTQAALARRESRGAHQREDFPTVDPQFACRRYVSLRTEGSGSRGGSIISVEPSR